MIIVWKPVVGYEGLYEVSSIGLIRTVRREYKTGEFNHTVIMERMYMSFKVDDDGYYYVGLRKDKIRSFKRVNRLVCEAFHPNPENKPFVNHKDGIRKNNEEYNVEWSTISENALHSFRELGRKVKQSKPLFQYDIMGMLVKEWESIMQASVNGFNRRNLKLALRGKWKQYRGFTWSLVKKH